MQPDSKPPFPPVSTDSRIPVVFAPLGEALPTDAVLFEAPAQLWGGTSTSFTPAQDHLPGCACCAARVAAGRALGALLHDRARDKVAFFTRVLAVTRTESGRADILAALAHDPLASACFRLWWSDPDAHYPSVG